MNGGEIIARALKAHNVRFLFTLCGGHISPILSGCKQLGIRVVDTRHEATAVFAADAVARLTGIPGVAAVTAGPGVTNTLTAVQNARLAQSPIVILGGATATVLRGRGALQDIDQIALIRSSVKWALRARRLRELEPLLHEAFAIATEGTPGPVFLECPIDLLYDEALVRAWYAARSHPRAGAGIGERLMGWYLRWHLDRQFTPGRPLADPVPRPKRLPPSDRAVGRAATVLSRAHRPVMVIGSQSVLDPGALSGLRQAIENLGVPVYLSGMARGLLGPGHPLQLRHRRREALREADAVILAGVPCDFRLDYGAHIRRRSCLISINRNRRDLYLNRRPGLAVQGDPADFLRALGNARSSEDKPWATWRANLHEREKSREQEIAAQAAEVTASVNPLHLCRQIEAKLPDNSIVVADGGDFVATASYVLWPRGPLSWLDPGVFGTLGVGAGFALGAKLCRPEAEVWVVYGDGAFGYSLAEFDTFVRHGIPVIAVIGNDACWNQIAREQIDILKDDVGCMLRHADYHLAAAGLGAAGIVVDSNDAVPEVLETARRHVLRGRPVVINAILSNTDFRKGSISM